jgi:hypothetical protein
LFYPNAPIPTDKKKDEREFHPFSFSGKSFTFEFDERKTIRALREWKSKIFDQKPVLTSQYITKLSDVPSAGAKGEHSEYFPNFDLEVKIIRVFKIDDYSSQIRVIDSSNEIWFCQVLNLKYPWLKEGLYVRVRSATLENHQGYERTFGLKSISNIL